ncbi:unnamed protein product, partial [marine sediment metagenome]
IYSLKTKLNSLETKLAITSGYSFRDEYLRLLFIEALKSNRNLSLVIISPSASASKMRLLKEAERELNDRVIIYPGCFEHILENLSEYSSYLKQGIELEKKCISEEIIQGHSRNWGISLHHFEKSLHFTKIFEILYGKISQIHDLSYEDLIKLNLISAIGLLSIDCDIMALKALIAVKELFYKLLEFTQIIIAPKNDSGVFVSYKMSYKYSSNGTSRASTISFYSINVIFEELSKLAFIKNLAIQRKTDGCKWESILNLFNFVEEIQKYFSFWSDNKALDFEDLYKRYRDLNVEIEVQLLTSQNIEKIIKEKEGIILKNIISETIEKFDFSRLELDSIKSTIFF